MVKVISLSDEAYRKLRALKHGRSFSEVVIEIVEKGNGLTRSKKKISDFVGIWSDNKKEVDKMKRMIKIDRKKFKLREVKW